MHRFLHFARGHLRIYVKSAKDVGCNCLYPKSQPCGNFSGGHVAKVHHAKPSRGLSTGAAGLLMFDAFRLQLPQGCHCSLLQHSLLSSFAFRRTACPGVRRRAWAVRAAWSGNDKTEKEIAAHFAMFNRKAGEDRAKHAAGQNGQLKDWCAVACCASLVSYKGLLLGMRH